MNPKIVLFDLDYTLTVEREDTGMELCDDALAILVWLKAREERLKIVLVTHNDYAFHVCQKLKMDRFFDLILAHHDNTNKASHLSRALQHFGMEPSDAVFFDDVFENVVTGRRLGVRSIQVSSRTGITFQQVASCFINTKQ